MREIGPAVTADRAGTRWRRMRVAGQLLVGILLTLSSLLAAPAGQAPHAAQAAALPTSPAHPHPAASLGSAFGRLPISFEPNRGQADGHVAFLAHLGASTVSLSRTGIVLTLQRSRSGSGMGRGREQLGPRQVPTRSTIRLGFVGALPHPRVTGEQPLPGRVNYFLGKDPRHWHTNIPTYARVLLHNVYPGIDLAVYGRQGHLEYDWLLHPHANPGAIRLSVSGGHGIHVDRAGNLVASSMVGDVVQNKPVIYQRIGGARHSITGRYVPAGRNIVGFHVGSYSHRMPLVIDPVVQYSTYVGGSNDDAANGVVVDNAGNLYLVGDTQSTNMPSATNGCTVGAAGCFNAFIAKLSAATGAIIYTTYFGGTYDNNSGNGLALDGAGNIFVVGNTQSTDLPRATNSCILFYGLCMQRAYIASFVAATGTLTYSTYVGGTSTSSGTGIALDGSGNAFIVGTTASTDMPSATNAFHANSATDAYVSELTGATGGILSSTYVGGSAADNGMGIALGSSSSVFITGYTTSTDLPAATNSCAACSAGQVGFMARLDASTWTISYSTYINGSSRGTAIAMDGSGNAFVTGYTFSFNGLPGATNSCTPTALAPSTCEDAFVTKIIGTTGAAVYSTYVGGSGGDQGYAIAVDGAGNPFLAGYTESPNLPGATNTCAGSTGTSCPYSDSFVTKLNGATGTVLYSMYAGGTDHEDTYAVALDSAGNIYLAGHTNSIDLPNMTNLCTVTLGNGCSDAFVVKINAAAPTVTIQAGAGWNMVGGSPLTLWADSQVNWSFNAATPAWYHPTGTESAGTGAWEDVPTAGPRTVNTVVCTTAVSVSVTALRWNLVGNPCNRSVSLPTAARAYWWNPTTKAYVSITSINPGAAAWVRPAGSTLTLS